MERNLNNREFEQYIKKNADQYRMIPSEKVWKGINNSLHTRRRWYGIGLTLLLVSTVSVTWVMLSYPSTKQHNSTVATSRPPATVTIDPVNPQMDPTREKPSADIGKILAPARFDKSENQSTPDHPSESIINTESVQQSAIIQGNLLTEREYAEITVKAPAISSARKQAVNEPAEAVSEFTAELKEPPYLHGEVSSMMNKPMHSQNEHAKSYATIYPLTIESVVNSYKPKKTHKKLSWQIYVTPTVSYRRLKANKEYRNEGPFANPITYPFSSLTDVNKAVTHKPDMGLELGFLTRYPITKNLKLRGGLQFNINRYDIKAFVYNGEQATINLSGDNNAVTAWTYYRNYNGYKTDWLKNFYFSVSAPIGAEMTLFGNSNTSFGIAGTVQPTYILREKAYLISTDYKNYAKVPWLIRDLNVNTSFETFVNFTSRNKTRWQIGPQVRYQVLSSFHNKYPVRENLFDFGMKFGVMLN